jgi:hypothetical protein
VVEKVRREQLSTESFHFLRTRAEGAAGYRFIQSEPATEEDLRACEASIASRLPRSLRECLLISNGFELLDPDVSIIRVFPASEIASATKHVREVWSDPDGASAWGDFIKIARSDHTESTYAVRPLSNAEDTPLHEMWSEGWDTWQTDPPLAPTFGNWLVSIADAISTGDHQRVYDTLWLGPTQPGGA